jgi:hypothetical protein
MRGAIPPLPNTPPWRGARLKNTETLLPLPYEEDAKCYLSFQSVRELSNSKKHFVHYISRLKLFCEVQSCFLKMQFLYPVCNRIIRVSESRMRWAGHVVYMGEIRNL